MAVTKRICVVLLLILLSGNLALAQFVDSGIALEGTYGSAVNWVDIDGDGDLDLVISGYNYLPSSARGKLYLNNGTTLVFNRDVRLLQDADETWCDFNRDGLPDMLYAGKYPTNAYSAGIDIFDPLAGFTWTGLTGNFTPVINASVDFGDIDNDGDYDAMISGQEASGYIFTRLYRNDNAVFTDIGVKLPGVIDGKVAFIDYDLDQDLDIFISGTDVNGNKYTRLWKNTGGTFAITADLFPNLKYSQFDWGDINSDGYPDLLLGGSDNTSYVGYIYISNSGSGFSLSSKIIPGCYQGSSGFADINNDGFTDIFISGKKQNTALDGKFTYLNDGAGNFNQSSFSNTPVTLSYFQFGDWNKDNKLDYVVNGFTASGGLTVIDNNNGSTANVKPSAPLNPTAKVTGRDVQLSWSHSTDDKTPRKSLTYNIYVGTTTGGINVVSPNATVSTGFRRISRQGYIQDTAWIIKNLPMGTYYWGVQAIDASYGASSFSAEGTFEIKDRFTLVTSAESPSVTSPAAYFDADHDNDLDIFLNTSDVLYAVQNNLTPFTQANYRTILANGYNPIRTIAPNDYNNNNKIDFSISGNSKIDGILDSTIALYGYNSAFNYSMVNNSLVKNLDFEYVLWADLNNDGKQDLITSGMTTNLGAGNKPATYIYRNLGAGSFQKVPLYIRGFEKCNAVQGDFDNDRDIDFIIYGKDSTGTSNTYIYINNGNFSFTEQLIPGNQLSRTYPSYGIFTGDFDMNGELDIFLAGESPASDFYSKVLLNHNLVFTDANLPIRSTSKMSNFWADYDNDGDLDIFFTSLNSTSDKTWLYINNGGTLQEVIIDLGARQLLDLPFMAVNLDKKNGLDFLMKRYSLDYLYYQYYDNWGGRINPAAPVAPSNLSFVQDKLDIILKWDKPSGCTGCTYNIRVGTTSGGVDIVSPMADLTTGTRYVVQPGNSSLNNSWKLAGLAAGTYYWAVQAVEPSNSGGPWSVASTFNVTMINTDFSYSTVCSGNETVFTDLTVASSPVNKWKWTFGDGAVSILQNPTHLYSAAGTYTVGLWAYSQAGDSAFRSYPVTVKALPIVDFTANIACQGTPTTFVNNTNVNGLAISAWFWNFGDGATSGVQNPGTHGYLNPGDYQATLVVTADNGCSDLKTKTVTVSFYPIAVIAADRPLTFCKGDSVTLSVSYDSKYTYNWLYGGINITEGKSAKYVARLSGSYSVNVVNTTGNCLTISSAVNVTSNELPVAPLITASGPVSFCQGDSVILSVINTTGYNYRWKLNGGVVGVNSNQLIAKEAGIYSLTVTNASGCSVEASNKVTVTVYLKPALPAISINGSTTFCLGQSVELSVTFNPAFTYQWEKGGSAITGAISNNYVAQTSGAYTLKITNSSGCSIRSDAVIVTVLTAPSPPVITTAGQTQICQGDSVALSITAIAGYDYNWKLNGGAIGSNSNILYAKISGLYNVLVSNTAGCSVTSSNNVTIVTISQPPPSTVSLSGPASFCSGGSVTMSVSPETGYSYSWKNEYGFIPGASVASYTADVSGIYQLRITNTTGCSIFTPPVTVSVNSLPVKPLVQADNYSEGGCLGETPIKLHVDQVINGYTYQWYRNGKILSGETKSYLEGFLQEGDYTVEAILNSCKTLSDGQNLKFEDAPAKPYIYAIGENMWYLVCSDSSAAQYKWYFNDNLIQGATKYIYVANKKLGKYYVSIANEKGCFTFSDTVTIPLGSTNLNDLDPFAGMKIYPNPTTGLITIEMENQLSGDLLISVIAGNGQEILKKKFEKTTIHSTFSLDLSGKSKGIYFLNLKLGKFNEARRIVLQ